MQDSGEIYECVKCRGKIESATPGVVVFHAQPSEDRECVEVAVTLELKAYGNYDAMAVVNKIIPWR